MKPNPGISLIGPLLSSRFVAIVLMFTRSAHYSSICFQVPGSGMLGAVVSETWCGRTRVVQRASQDYNCICRTNSSFRLARSRVS
ncbi:hypothetical protein DE146DRAFT_49584 [Phaeosphaeria sp. MPI-PUGE-AT-0046c]|nr:hypothetical protein DE146DRAFT_49584 [Phaeosphaeria sp. MPI-PUGE-AT-0046c]